MTTAMMHICCQWVSCDTGACIAFFPARAGMLSQSALHEDMGPIYTSVQPLVAFA